MAQPKIPLPHDPWDKYLIGITIFFGLFLVGYPILNYGELPPEIPVHFRADGNPDRYGSKVEIWIIPIIGISLTVLLRGLATIPHTFNYAVKITPENAVQQYQIATRLMKVLAAVIMVGLSYIVYAIIHSAKEQYLGLSSWFLPVFLGAIFLPIGYFLSQSYKRNNN